MKKIKIAFLVLNELESGLERVVSGIIKNMKNKPNIYLTVIGNEEIIGKYEKIKNISTFNLGKIGNNTLELRLKINSLAKKLKKILSEEEFDVISLHSEPSMEIFGKIRKETSPIPFSTFHGRELEVFSKSYLKNRELIRMKGILYLIKMIYYRMVMRENIKKSLDKGFTTTIANHQKNYLSSDYLRKSFTIPNGVYLSAFGSLKSIEQEKNIVLFAGRFIDWKGIREILNVAKQLPQYEFWFAGKGDLSDEIEGENVKNLGIKKTNELIKLYNQATICIFPSWHEPFGLVGLEAMSCGRAVIATPLGFSEYIEDGKDGVIIPAKDEKALKNAIVDLMTNEKKRKMLEKNARKKAEEYSWDKITERYLKVFKEAIKENED